MFYVSFHACFFDARQVTVDASVTDESEEPWKTGPRHTLSIKALEDPYNAPKSSQAGPSTSQVGSSIRPPLQVQTSASSLPSHSLQVGI